MSDDHRYCIAIGHPTHGETREYKTLVGARRAAAKLVAEGWHVTIWEGTLRGCFGWSWSTVPLLPGVAA